MGTYVCSLFFYFVGFGVLYIWDKNVITTVSILSTSFLHRIHDISLEHTTHPICLRAEPCWGAR